MNTLSKESRKFKPSDDFVSKAKISSIDEYTELYKRSIDNPIDFWSDAANELHWFEPWENVLDSTNAPFYKWYVNGKTNISYNCLDRIIMNGKGDKVAFFWEGEPGDKRSLTFRQLLESVNNFANVLKNLGVDKGDRVALYLPMIPELIIAVLACARIGAVHSVIFAGFSAESIRDRIDDSKVSIIITADGGYRRGKVLELKKTVDEGIKDSELPLKVLVVKRGGGLKVECPMLPGRDYWFEEISMKVSSDCPPEHMDSEDLLFLLYTSGTTGKPKGIMHTTGGYQVFSYLTSKYVFDLKDDDVYWCTADIGWITGHTYIIYGILQNGATQLIYEGAPNHPKPDRFWKLVDSYKVSIFYTAPTAIRSFMKWGDRWLDGNDLSSLRLLGTVGEPINPEAWIWYHQKIGSEKCPIVDTWWQTETGGHLLTPMPGAISTKPGSAAVPFFGIEPLILNDEGEKCDSGILAIKQPWPGMLRGIYKDEERYKDTYWSKWGGKYYFPGDGARIDKDGYYWILGRVDDVVNVSGHRIGTAELESIFVEHDFVAESAVIGISHEIKGQCLLAFVSLIQGYEENDRLSCELNDLVDKRIGKFARPEKIVYCSDLPKTRSGKIMRRLLRSIAEGESLGNITTLADPDVINEIQSQF